MHSFVSGINIGIVNNLAQKSHALQILLAKKRSHVHGMLSLKTKRRRKKERKKKKKKKVKG